MSRAPDGPGAIALDKRLARRRFIQAAIQVGGFIIGLALLGWCASITLAPENREQLDRLARAPWSVVLALVGLSAVSLVLNGLTFWAILRPARRLRATDVVATNTIATMLGYLPFKLGLIARIAIHNRRDGLPLALIGAWLAAFTLALAIAIGPLVLIAALRPRLDAAFAAAAIVAIAAAIGAAVLVARAFAGERGLGRLDRLVGWLAPARAALRSGFGRNLHAAFDMLASPGALASCVALRLADVAVQAARLGVAGAVIGRPLALDEALLFSLAYFLIGVVSPSGVLGTREGGTTALASLLAVAASDDFAVMALVVTVTDGLVVLTAGALSIAWLRPDRLLRLRALQAAPPLPPPAPPPPDREVAASERSA